MADQLYRDVEWSHVIRLPVLGLETTFTTNSAAVADVIAKTYGGWSLLARDPDLITSTSATVRIIVDRPTAPTPMPVFTYHVPDPSRLVVLWDGGAGIADTQRLESLAYVTADVVDRSGGFTDGVLEALTLFLLNSLDREPLHAAAVVRDGVAILLAGPSGVGKSTLTYAAYRRGYSFLSDEPVYVQSRPGLRVWGRKLRMHLSPEAKAHFPELGDIEPTRLPTGKTKLVVELRDRIERYAEHAGICILKRDSASRPALERVSPERVVAELTAQLEPGFDLFAATIGDRIGAIARRGAWYLHVGAHPDDAVALLDEVAAELSKSR